MRQFNIRSFLANLKKFNSKTRDEKENNETPDSPAFIHFSIQRLQKQLPEAVFHLFDRTGLRAWSDDYKLVAAQAVELGIDMKSADTLITKTETCGVTFFFGDGYVWVELGGLGIELLQKGNN